jgi:hypothetical protein
VGKSARPLAGRRRGPRPSPDHAWRKASRPDRSTSVAIGRKFCRTAERFHISEAPRAGDSPARESGLRVSAPPREKSPLRRVHRPRLQPNSGSPGRFALPSLSVPDFISSRFSLSFRSGSVSIGVHRWFTSPFRQRPHRIRRQLNLETAVRTGHRGELGQAKCGPTPQMVSTSGIQFSPLSVYSCLISVPSVSNCFV